MTPSSARWRSVLKASAEQKAHLVQWLPFAFVSTVLIGASYVSFSSHIRTSADDPQIYLSENLAAQLFRNEDPAASLAAQKVDIARSVAPFVILYDSNGRAADGTGRLNDQLPELPKHAYDTAQSNGESRFTWQPQSNIRIAAVVRYYQNEKHAGYVLAGKNLREVQREQTKILSIAVASWAITLFGSLLLTGIGRRPLGKSSQKQ